MMDKKGNENTFESYKKEVLRMIEELDHNETKFMQQVYTILVMHERKRG